MQTASTPERCQNLIIGSGESGKQLAWELGKMGQQVLVVERSLIGGSCPNIACLPTKNFIYSARVASLMRRGAEFGIADGAVKVDMRGVYHRKKQMVDSEVQVHLKNYENSSNELLMGEARFIGPKTVSVAVNAGGTRTIQGERIFLNVGTRAAIPNVPGLAEAQPLTHVEALDLQRLPEHLVVYGGGYVGLEFAQALRRFGSRVTIVAHGSQLLSREDADVADGLLQLMRDEGIEVLLNTELAKVTGLSGQKLTLELRSGQGTKTLEASEILVAVGRTPNTDRLDAEKGGVKLDASGYIRVNERLETTAPEVWALGECAGSPKYTHVAFDDFRIVRDNLAGGKRTTTGRLIPFCLFTDPELAHVGLSETEAKTNGVRYRLAKIPMTNVLRTHTISEPRGFLKALIGGDDSILGFTAFGAEASEFLAAMQTAMLGKIPYQVVRDAIYAHPTMVEGLGPLLGSVPARAGS
jgi:pyruvate/2-oxoglutarate dehydrogenase complex dihydrolipoamide dehydrogenase (E3) component